MLLLGPHVGEVPSQNLRFGPIDAGFLPVVEVPHQDEIDYRGQTAQNGQASAQHFSRCSRNDR